MNTIIKYCAIALVIALGFAMPLQAQIRGLYDVKVDFQNLGSTWNPWVITYFEKEIVIHQKANFIFPSFPNNFNLGPEDPGNATNILHAVDLYVKFKNDDNDNFFYKITPNSAVLKDYSSVLSSTNEANPKAIEIEFVLAGAGNTPNGLGQYSTLNDIQKSMTAKFSIKHEATRPYIAPDEIIDIVTDNTFSPPSGTYSSATQQSSLFFNAYTSTSKGEGKAYVMYSNSENKKLPNLLFL